MHNYREGDRSEYLALYFFSALGLVTQIPRQEDIGFDFVCSIADQETGRLTFNHQYLLTIKSKGSPLVKLEPGKTVDPKRSYLKWIFQTEMPLLLALVDKENQEVLVYSTSPIWFLPLTKADCGSMTLVPRVDSEDESDVGEPRRGDALSTDENLYHYDVDLGHPIARASLEDLRDKEKLRKLKENLRFVVDHDRLTKLNASVGAPYFYWFNKTYRDGRKPSSAFYAASSAIFSNRTDLIYGRMAPALISLAMIHNETGETKQLQPVLDLLANIPRSYIPEVVHDYIERIKTG